ncbi:putative holin-like toxin [Paenibacillus lactis]|nr:putative holin-like toxin [Paenibacillus lactis]MCM3496948.1 putative holin-like toxin [Paenibacillus lactis]
MFGMFILALLTYMKK